MALLQNVIQRGTHAARPAAGSAGVLYFEQDTCQLFRDSGSSWQLDDTSLIFTAKGQLLCATGSGTVAALAAGTDTYILTADSSQATGIKWAAPTSAGTLASYVYNGTTAGDYTTSSTSFVDIDGTNISATLTTGAHRCLVTLTGTVNSPGSGNSVCFDVVVDGTRQFSGNTSGLTDQNASANNMAMCLQYVTAALSAGSHTIKVQWRVVAGTATLRRAAGQSGVHFSVVELYA